MADQHERGVVAALGLGTGLVRHSWDRRKPGEGERQCGCDHTAPGPAADKTAGVQVEPTPYGGAYFQ